MSSRHFRALSIGTALLAGAFALSACGSNTASTSPPSLSPVGSSAAAGSFTAASVSPVIQPPSGTFASTTGQSAYDLAGSLKGRVTLVYFGYTECPDVCPTTMAALGAALRSLPKATDDDVQVVFVTSDPAHDTPAVMTSWLNGYDSEVSHPFLGLNTAFPAVQKYAAQVGVELDTPTSDASGHDESTHGAQVLAFSPDGVAHRVWLAGTTAPQYAADIAMLVAGRT